ncbi:unnamed protein product, partial [Porites evermanni]
ATAASTSDARSALRATNGAGLLPCPDCGREFCGKAGVSQHQRRAHKEAYHKDHVLEQRKKARWVYEEKVLLERVEKNMVELGLTITSKTMAEQFPSRYSEVSGPQMTDSTEQCGWSDALRRALEGVHLDLGEVTIEEIVPGCPDNRVRSALDIAYEAWLPSRERHAPGSRPQPQRTEAQDRPRVRRRAQYARVRPEYTKNRSRCAQDVISGAWQDPPATLPMGTQQPFWRSLFERTSVPDNRCPQPVGPPTWELMAPIKTEDVERSLKGMKDGAPGPDGNLASRKIIQLR